MVKKIIEEKADSPAERKERLNQARAFINKKAGRDVLKWGEIKELKRLLFSSDELNEITGGGLGVGRFNIIWGPKAASKTTSCYGLISNAQQEDKLCAWIDLEQSFDSAWATINGVDVENLIICNEFKDAEEVMDTIMDMTKQQLVDVIVIDSIQGLSPRGEHTTKKGKEKSMDDDTMGLLARRLGKFFRMSAAGIALSECTIVLIGQSRKDLGGFIAFDKLSGGNALEHWSSLTMQVRRGKKENAPAISTKTGNTVKANNENAKMIGFEIVAKIEKSKLGADECKEARLPFYYGSGFRKPKELEDDKRQKD